ncbi:MAG TPA: hypothetical protein VF482_12745 [Trebonia sp.]
MTEGGHCPISDRNRGQRCDAGRHINLADPYVPAARDAEPEPGGEQDGDSEQAP